MTQHMHTITLPNASAYILEGCLQNAGPCTTPNKIYLWGKMWDKVRSSVNRNIKLSWEKELVDFETPVLRQDNETELAFKKREVEFNNVFKEWGNQKVNLIITDKYRDAIRVALKYVIEHKDDERAQTRVANNLHWGELLFAFGLITADDDETVKTTDSDKV